MTVSSFQNMLPSAAGVGYKSTHFSALRADPGPVQWLEVHAENYLGDGGRPLAQLAALAEDFQISVHGVGLSIGGEMPLDQQHLKRVKRLCDWLSPASFSEHLAWSSHGLYYNDLLPLPYTQTTLDRVCSHIDQVQETLGRRMLLENPSSYLWFDESTFSEVEFIREIAKRTGCGLLLDVNNVFVSASNLGMDAQSYIDAFPTEHIGELHLGGHDEDTDDQKRPLLIDSHGKPVADPVWALYELVLQRTGPMATLIEWDTDVPDWPTLKLEAERAAAHLGRAMSLQHAA